MKKKLLLVNIFGGIGNQLFQYSTAFSLAKRENRKLIILDCCNAEREFGLTDLNINENIENCEYKLNFTSLKKITTWVRILTGEIIETIEDPIFKKDNRIFENNKSDILILNGYWGWSDYFEKDRSELTNIFLSSQRTIISENFYIFGVKNSVAIHIRRGDYTNNENKILFHLLNIEYYIEAIKIMETKLGSPVFYVFTDDATFFKNNISPILSMYTKCPIILTNSNMSPTSVLLHMSNCYHQIIANSTFSWWAAYLNTNLNKIIIQPKKWYTNILAQKVYEEGEMLTDKNWIKI